MGEKIAYALAVAGFGFTMLVLCFAAATISPLPELWLKGQALPVITDFAIKCRPTELPTIFATAVAATATFDFAGSLLVAGESRRWLIFVFSGVSFLWLLVVGWFTFVFCGVEVAFIPIITKLSAESESGPSLPSGISAPSIAGMCWLVGAVAYALALPVLRRWIRRRSKTRREPAV
jgi:hypothetical protein